MGEPGDSSGGFPAAFESAFAQLQVRVLEACGREEDWPAKVAAGIYATLDFGSKRPAAARLLAVDALIERAGGAQRYVRLVEYFADLLRAEAPRGERLPLSTEQALVGGIAVMVGDHMRANTFEHLREAGPELVWMLLLPYLGSAEAKRWAARTTPPVEGAA